jgi:outer membrane protein OmpA-like peptidoglycan-associated protein
MDKSIQYITGNFTGFFFTNQKTPISIGERIPDSELHTVNLYKGSLTEAISVKSFKPEKHLNREGMLLHNVTNVEISSSPGIAHAIYAFDQLVLKNVRVDSSWEQNNKMYGILKGELIGKIKKQSTLPIAKDDERIPPPPIGGGPNSPTTPIDGDNSSWNKFIPPIIADRSQNGGCLSSIWSILKWLLLLLLILFLLNQCRSNIDKYNYDCLPKVDSLEKLTKNQKAQIDSLTNLVFIADSLCDSKLKKERLQYELDNLSSEIYFYGGTINIRKYSEDEINEIVNILEENPSVFIEIQGFYNGTGSSDIPDLDLKRANRVKDLIINKGVDFNRITTIGLGNTKPIDDSNILYTDPYGNKYNANMRVEIKIVKY